MSMTYAELHAEVSQVSRRLVARQGSACHKTGWGGAAVALLVDDGPAMVSCGLGIIRSGATLVPISPAFPADRVGYMLDAAGAVLAVLPGPASGDLLECLDARAIPWLLASDLTNPDVIDEDQEPDGPLELHEPDKQEEQNEQQGQDALDNSALVSPRWPTPEDRCYIIFTSGSTGRPKGVAATHANMASYCRAKNEAHGISGPPASRPSRVLLLSPNTFDPSLGDTFATLAAGAILCLPRRVPWAEPLAETLRRTRCTHVCSTPAVWGLLGPRATPRDFPDLEVLALGGEPMSKDFVRRWAPRRRKAGSGGASTAEAVAAAAAGAAGEAIDARSTAEAERAGTAGTTGTSGLRLINTYGCTEATVYQTYHDIELDEAEKDEEQEGKQQPAVEPVARGPIIGQPLRGVVVEVVDAGTLAPVQDGQEGEIVVAGPQVCGLGYVGQPELTAKAFVRLPAAKGSSDDGSKGGGGAGGGDMSGRLVYRTGDRGVRDPAAAGGLLRYLGRVDMQVKVRGVRVELGELEGVLLDCGSVVREAVVKLFGAKGDSDAQLHAWVALDASVWGSSIPAAATTAAAAAAAVSAAASAAGTAGSGGSGDRGGGGGDPPHCALLSRALRLHCQKRLPRDLVPAFFHVHRSNLPHTASGKIDRAALQPPQALPAAASPSAGSASTTRAVVRPGTMEYAVAAAWTIALETAHADVDDPSKVPVAKLYCSDSFVLLGGDSLSALRACLHLRRLVTTTGASLTTKPGVQTVAAGPPRAARTTAAVAGEGAGGPAVAAGLSVMERNANARRPLFKNELLRPPSLGHLSGVLSPAALMLRPVLGDYAASIEAAGYRVIGEHSQQASGSPAESTRDVGTEGEHDGSGFEDRGSRDEDGREDGDADEDDDLSCGVGRGAVTVRSEGFRALLDAAKAGYLPALHVLVSSGFSVNGTVSRRQPGWTPLHFAAASGTVAAVNLLLGAGALPNLQTATGRTALHCAAVGLGMPEPHATAQEAGAPATGADPLPPPGVAVVRRLLEAGIAPRARDRAKQTAVHAAARTGRPSIIRELHERASMPLEEIDRWHRTPLHWAVLNGHLQAVATLLELGASPNPSQVRMGYHVKSTSLLYETPLHIAVRRCAAPAGASPELLSARSNCSEDAVGAAAALEIVETLLAAGADANAEDQAGNTAIDVSRTLLKSTDGKQDNAVASVQRLLTGARGKTE